MPRDSPDFGLLLGIAYQQFAAGLQDHLGRGGFNGIGPSFGYVLRALIDDHLTTSQLAGRLQITPQGAAGIVGDMEKAGYVERRPDPADARLRRLYLTERGQEAIGELRRFHRDFERRLAKKHGPKQVKAVRTVLTAIAEAQAPEEASGPPPRLL